MLESDFGHFFGEFRAHVELSILAPGIFIRGLRLAKVAELLMDGGHFKGGGMILIRLSDRNFRFDDCRDDNLLFVYIG